MTRILTAAVGLIVIFGVTVWAPRWVFVALVVLVAVLSLDEFLGMVTARGMRGPGRWWAVPGALVTLSVAWGSEWAIWALIGGLIVLSAVSIASGRGADHLEYLSFGLAGIIYTCVLPGFILLISPEGFWVLAATVWSGDTAAYYGGRALGRHRLAPVLSPNKTVEGAIAGGLASLVMGTLIGSALLPVSVPSLAGMCLLTGAAGQLGDLTESAMKRTAGLKDSASRLPGHGGILDRVDSLLFAGPVFHALMLWVR